MTGGLEGKRIVIAGSRKISELSTIIEKQGGIPVVRSQQGTLFLAESEVERDLLRVVESGSDWMMFTTGTGLEALFNQAERIGIRSAFLEIVKQSKVAARGYKTYALLKKMGIQPVAVDDDGTTQGLIKALETYEFTGQGVTIQLHGEPMPSLVTFLENKGAVVRTLLPYKHMAPDDTVSRQLCQELADGSVDAVCFTTAVQVRYFFQFVKSNGYYPAIHESFKKKVLAAAVGKVTAEALKEEGVERVLAPESERMGAMIIELAHYYQNKSTVKTHR
ncbi:MULTISPECIES: uroporphyrinogen-III synthase [Paenibacillus]|uniref:uroporphyrinogen-III synthase n=1 Tax=Paenibacillus TaxID=44249 RepID=UPI001141D93E|nr:uroporphyrinogen-III synthase [Paenibacillus sp. tmac-D7]